MPLTIATTIVGVVVVALFLSAAFLLLASLAFLGRAVHRPGRRERRAGQTPG